MKFEIISEIQEIETIAVGSSIRDLDYLQKMHGRGRWRKLKGVAYVKEIPAMWNFTGTKRMELGKETSRSKNTWINPMTAKTHFVICIDNTDYEASLIVRKMYEIVPDPQAEKDDMLRVIDESGEDYLFHASYFISIELPAEVERALIAA